MFTTQLATKHKISIRYQILGIPKGGDTTTLAAAGMTLLQQRQLQQEQGSMKQGWSTERGNVETHHAAISYQILGIPEIWNMTALTAVGMALLQQQ